MAIEHTNRADLAGTLDYLEGRWRDVDRTALKHGFGLLAQGRRVPPAALAERGGVSPERITATLDSGPVGLDARGAIVELFGVMLASTIHRVETDGRATFACCALVAHAVPVLIARSVKVESVDPVSRRIVRLRLNPEAIEEIAPRGAVASFPTPPSREDRDDVRRAFCSHLKHFADESSAAEFAARNGRRRVLALESFHELARELATRIWSV